MRAGWAARGGGGGASGEKRPISKGTVRRVVQCFSPYKPQVWMIGIAVLISAGLGGLASLLPQYVIDRGLMPHNLPVMAHYIVYMLVAAIAASGTGLWYGYLSVIVGQDIMRDLRNQLFEHLQAMPLRFFTGTRSGEVQSRLVNDVGGIQSVVSDTASNLLNNVVQVLTSLTIMIHLSWQLTILSVGILPVFAFLAARVGALAHGVRGKNQENLANLNATIQETLSVSGILLMKTSGRQDLAVSKFHGENEAVTGTQIKLTMIMRVFFTLMFLSFSVTPALVYWLAGYLIITDHDSALTIGKIVAFTGLQARMFFPLTNLLSAQVDITSSLALFDRIFEYLDLKPDIQDQPDALALSPKEIRGAVRFEHVTFRYEQTQEEPTLSDITFEAKPGELVALVGPSGAGKTSLVYLIPRLYDVESGRVLVDNHDVRDIKLISLQQAIGMVTQETYLIHDTIRQNLRYGRPDATDEEIVAAAKVAAIHDHILSLPEGYDTVVGERGYKLSGGEKQRIAIARAVLKDPRILILDEATSALDTQSERLVQGALVPLMAGRTTFAIAHRLSTILAADLILVIEKGRIVEQGTHSRLLAAGGAYTRLYEAQFQSQREEDPIPA